MSMMHVLTQSEPATYFTRYQTFTVSNMFLDGDFKYFSCSPRKLGEDSYF